MFLQSGMMLWIVKKCSSQDILTVGKCNFSDLFIYLLFYSFFFFLHFCKRMQQKSQYITKARQNVEQKITEIVKGEMCAVTKGA